MNTLANLLRVSTLSVALLGATALATAVVTPDVAYAGKGNDKGGGNGGGNSAKSDNGKSASAGGKGGSKAKGASAGKGKSTAGSSQRGKLSLKSLFGSQKKESASKSKRTASKSKASAPKVKKAATAQAPSVTTAPAPKPKGNRLAATLGVHPSELGALNAANASPTALANASPNSRVGKLALYAEAVGMTQALQDELATAQAELDLLKAPERTQQQIDDAIGVAGAEKQALETELAGLQQALFDAGGEDAAIEADIRSVQDAIAAKDTELSELDQERRDGEAYALAEEEVERIQMELDGQEADQRAALEDAANKPVTDEIELAVQHMLGLLDEEIASSN